MSRFGTRLTQSDLWPKYGHASCHRQDNQDQRFTWTTQSYACPSATRPLRRRWKSSSITLTRENAGETGSFPVAMRQTLHISILIHNSGMSDHPFLNDRSAEQYFLDEAPDIAAFRAAFTSASRSRTFGWVMCCFTGTTCGTEAASCGNQLCGLPRILPSAVMMPIGSLNYTQGGPGPCIEGQSFERWVAVPQSSNAR